MAGRIGAQGSGAAGAGGAGGAGGGRVAPGMTAAGVVYSRKVSSEESREGYLMVLKDKLRAFPPLGAEFELAAKGDLSSPCTVKVESYPCTCMGPDKPHEHYFIRWLGLTKGQRVEISRDGSGRYIYEVS